LARQAPSVVSAGSPFFEPSATACVEVRDCNFTFTSKKILPCIAKMKKSWQNA
jgi:hypothetical protein